jgi:hypothetical protein
VLPKRKKKKEEGRRNEFGKKIHFIDFKRFYLDKIFKI